MIAINTDTDSELLHKLFEHTISDDPNLRAAAYRAMANFDPPDNSTLSCLINGLNDPDSSVRKAAAATLLNLGYLNRKR